MSTTVAIRKHDLPPTEPSAPLQIVSEFSPAGDQPQAISALIEGLKREEKDQVLLGVTGSGKTFTVAHVIQELQRPALVLAPNKTLAAQLFQEMKAFFPNNAVEYFVSYYDYYQPEAYVARTDTYIEKESSVNEQIDRMRHSATRALLERRDVIIVASVSCIYGIGDRPRPTAKMTMPRSKQGQHVSTAATCCEAFVELHYKRNDASFGPRHLPGPRRQPVEIFPAHLRGPGLAPLLVRRRDRIDLRDSIR